MYLNFEAFKGIEKIEKVEIFLVFPNPMGILNQKNLWPTLIYQFEHSGTPYSAVSIKNIDILPNRQYIANTADSAQERYS